MPASVRDEGSGQDQVDPDKLFRKISWRLIPYLFVLYIFAYLDRVNLGFAASEFKTDLHLSASVYGLGAGLYFIGQLMFDLPSNLMLNRVGPRLWIARIMISWGIIATCMTLVRGEWSFYGMRLLLGISEAGFFPGIILYLSFWFPSGQRAKAVARFMTATAIAGIVGAELWRWLQRLEGVWGLHGWQWLFVAEGVPTILLGISVLFFLRDRPDDAPWLTDGERHWLDAELDRDRREGGAHNKQALLDAFKMPMVWLLAVIFLLDQLGIYTVNLWMPLILKSVLHVSSAAGNLLVDRYGALPYLAAAIFMVIVGWSSDRTGERRWHIAGCLLLSAAGFAWAAYAHSLLFSLMAFSLAAMGYWSVMGPFWALPTRVLGGQAAAGGVAIITMIGSLGGFGGPALTGKLRDATHGFKAGLLVIGALALVAAALCLLLQGKSEKRNSEDNSGGARAL
jgi:ACS family tartrate transporter-like MFS transporter